MPIPSAGTEIEEPKLGMEGTRMSNAQVVNAVKSADLIITKLLAVKPGEEVVLIADTETDLSMAHALAGVAESVGADL